MFVEKFNIPPDEWMEVRYDMYYYLHIVYIQECTFIGSYYVYSTGIRTYIEGYYHGIYLALYSGK